MAIIMNPTDEVRPDIKAASFENCIEIRNDSDANICKVCGKWDCKKVNHTPAATNEQCGVAKHDGWW